MVKVLVVRGWEWGGGPGGGGGGRQVLDVSPSCQDLWRPQAPAKRPAPVFINSPRVYKHSKGKLNKQIQQTNTP